MRFLAIADPSRSTPLSVIFLQLKYQRNAIKIEYDVNYEYRGKKFLDRKAVTEGRLDSTDIIGGDFL